MDHILLRPLYAYDTKYTNYIFTIMIAVLKLSFYCIISQNQDKTHFLYIRRNNLYFVGVTKFNVAPACALEVLGRYKRIISLLLKRLIVTDNDGLFISLFTGWPSCVRIIVVYLMRSLYVLISY